MIIKTLNTLSTDTLCAALNTAFSDYLIPLQLTTAALGQKLNSEGFDASLSPGVFEDNILKGFIFHATGALNGQKIAYNCATGVAPSSRGKKYTTLMYDFILPKLASSGVKRLVHEVLQKNERAIKVYKAQGFEIKRTLTGYSGALNIKDSKAPYNITPFTPEKGDVLQAFWDIEPTWQNSTNTITKLPQVQYFGAFEAGAPLGYVAFNTSSKRLHQIAVSKQRRGQGLGRALLKYVQDNITADINIINIDDKCKALFSLLDIAGLKPMDVNQYEMVKALK